MQKNYLAMIAAALVLGQAACTIADTDNEGGRGAREARAATPAPAANLVTVTAREFAFGAPATIPAGLTTVRLVNQGQEMHHVQLVWVDEGHTVAELLEMAKSGGAIPAWARFVGGPNAHAPGAHSESTMVLQAGEYALVCFIPSPDGVPHIAKGMVKPLTVVPAANDAQAAEADVRMTLTDYAFDVAPEIIAGRRTIRVLNTAAQPHEVALMRLAPGKTPQDLLGWIETQQGTPPAMPLGGTAALSQGEANQITADFTPGEYVLLCFVPDARDGKPHVAHGMVRQITVR